MGLTVAVLLTACGADPVFDNEYAPSFSFNVGWHKGCIIEDALSIAGTFVFISVPTDGNPRFVITPSNPDREEVLLPVSEIERRALEAQRQSPWGTMGINRRLLVGTSNFDGLKAFDGHCPSCHAETGRRDYPLTWTENHQHVGCANCGRVYNPNGNGSLMNAKGSSDRNLKNYGVDYNGQILTVRNK